jgi:hypothetical protein
VVSRWKRSGSVSGSPASGSEEDPTAPDQPYPSDTLLRIEALEQQVATLTTIVGFDRSHSDAEHLTVIARLRALEEAAAVAGRRKRK